MLNNLNLIPYLFISLTFAAVALLVVGIGKLYIKKAAKERLAEIVGRKKTLRTTTNLGAVQNKWAALIESLSRLSLPATGWQDSNLRLRFIRAGLRDTATPRIYFAIKSLLLIGALLITSITLQVAAPVMPLNNMLLYVLLIAIAGYYLPDLYLHIRTRQRADEMRDALPGLMDLLVICAESGLEMDAAINRVSREYARTSPQLSEEFYLAALEIRAGSGRSLALKNLSLRVDLEDLYNLVSMLVQADKLGTSLSESLRIQSEVMRTKRMQRAEEIAAKVPVKMLMPLVFFIFPTLMIVLLGPAAIQIASAFSQ